MFLYFICQFEVKIVFTSFTVDRRVGKYYTFIPYQKLGKMVKIVRTTYEVEYLKLFANGDGNGCNLCETFYSFLFVKENIFYSHVTLINVKKLNFGALSFKYLWKKSFK